MRADGATQPGRASPLIDRGARAAEADQRGPTRDAIDSAAASTARDPMPLELGRTSAGGESDAGGVKGARRAGAPGLSTTMDTAASRANLAPGTGPIALRASRQDPYFRRMYQRLDRAIVFPRELAIALEQGEVVVAFQLRVTDGAIHQLEVVKSSGFAEFDDELLRALRATAPFGTVPAALRGRADHLRVTAPYWFRNTVVR
jgi:TonB family protein